MGFFSELNTDPLQVPVHPLARSRLPTRASGAKSGVCACVRVRVCVCVCAWPPSALLQ
jgi:hypothetical protein